VRPVGDSDAEASTSYDATNNNNIDERLLLIGKRPSYSSITKFTGRRPRRGVVARNLFTTSRLGRVARSSSSGAMLPAQTVRFAIERESQRERHRLEKIEHSQMVTSASKFECMQCATAKLSVTLHRG